MLTDLGAAFAELRDDASTRVVIVTGAPPVFSAGADAPARRAKTEEERRRLFTSRKSQFRRLFERANTLLENLEQATIAWSTATRWAAAGASTLACDFRIAAAEAQFWIPEVDLGVPLGVGTDHALRAHGRARRAPRRSSWAAAATRRPRPRRWGSCTGWCRARELAQAARDYAELLGREAVPPARRDEGAHQRDRARRHPRGQRDDRGVPRPRVSGYPTGYGLTWS